MTIPDAYNVTLQFTSLLPNSVNNHLYKFTANQDIYTDQGITVEIGDSFNTTMSKTVEKMLVDQGVIK